MLISVMTSNFSMCRPALTLNKFDMNPSLTSFLFYEQTDKTGGAKRTKKQVGLNGLCGAKRTNVGLNTGGAKRISWG